MLRILTPAARKLFVELMAPLHKALKILAAEFTLLDFHSITQKGLAAENEPMIRISLTVVR